MIVTIIIDMDVKIVIYLIALYAFILKIGISAVVEKLWFIYQHHIMFVIYAEKAYQRCV